MEFRERIMRPVQYEMGLLNLINQLGDTQNKRMVEIGSFVGESTILFAKHFREVIAVDPFKSGYDDNDTTSHLDFDYIYPEYIKRTEPYKNIKTIRLTSDDALDVLKDELFDFIYIDGVHTYEQVKIDIKNYLPLIKKGGAIAGHDYEQNFEGVKQAVHEMLGTPDNIFEDTSWIKFL